ncbi:11504_t:CDS:1 [Paraglomus brasilianum]|uniref:11504_t:CDS:1 n=1 Tax=Paraglomus brasilianum TaxID=144538 RepID=A0A9N8ZWL4_9GLOM|nr:11504_t:CDS:1 [Paraglomus brasilianum]
MEGMTPPNSNSQTSNESQPTYSVNSLPSEVPFCQYKSLYWSPQLTRQSMYCTPCCDDEDDSYHVNESDEMFYTNYLTKINTNVRTDNEVVRQPSNNKIADERRRRKKSVFASRLRLTSIILMSIGFGKSSLFIVP